MSDLILHRSASQRKIAALEATIDDMTTTIQHLRTHIAVMVYNAGGSVSVVLEDMQRVYDINLTTDEERLTWTSVRQPSTETI